ncbi:MAG TPA: hypothetical protein VG738_19575 [Chitinophagaceae bacterium]|nr:hypothetical protein [Chitinophagaceae bacterium]
MLQIAGQEPRPNDKYHAFAARYLHGSSLEGIVSAKQLHEKLICLNTGTVNGQFYFIIDVATNAIIHCNGVDRWLGYNCSGFTVTKYQNLIHPAHAVINGYYSVAMWGQLTGGNFLPIQFMRPMCITSLALKNNFGNYLLLRRLCSPWQIDKDGRLIQYINLFTIIKPFANECFFTKADFQFHEPGVVEKAVQDSVKKQFEGDRYFTPQEIRLLKKYLSEQASTSSRVATKLGLAKSTVSVYNKRIMYKATRFFWREFYSAKDVAKFINKCGLI